VKPAHPLVPQPFRNVFVNNGKAAFAKHAAHFIQDRANVLSVMENVAEQDCVKRAIRDRKMNTVVTAKVDQRVGAISQVDSNCASPEHSAQMVRYEAVTAADVEHFRAMPNGARDFQRHIISPGYLSPASLTRPAALE